MFILIENNKVIGYTKNQRKAIMWSMDKPGRSYNHIQEMFAEKNDDTNLMQQLK